MNNLYQDIVQFAQFMVMSQLGIIILLTVNMLLLAGILIATLQLKASLRLEDE